MEFSSFFTTAEKQHIFKNYHQHRNIVLMNNDVIKKNQLTLEQQNQALNTYYHYFVKKSDNCIGTFLMHCLQEKENNENDEIQYGIIPEKKITFLILLSQHFEYYEPLYHIVNNNGKIPLWFYGVDLNSLHDNDDDQIGNVENENENETPENYDDDDDDESEYY